MRGVSEQDYERLLDQGWIAYRNDDTASSIDYASQASTSAPRDGRGWYLLGCALERDQQLIAADRAFRKAQHAEIDAHIPPFRVSWRRFERAVSSAADALPSELSVALTEVHLVLVNYPAPNQLPNDEEIEILGCFEGAPRADLVEAAGDPESVPRIHLFRRPHEHATTSGWEFDQEVRRTLYHELGHYLGFDEDDMVRFGID